MILDEFGRRIEEIVDRLTRDRPDGTKLTVQEILNNAYKKGDKDVLLIKCMDRLHNIQTIGAKSPEKIEKTVRETLVNFLLLIEELSLPKIGDLLYNKCLQSNVEIGLIPANNLKKQSTSFDEEFILPFPVVQSE
ncbi:hypothetical protein N9N97_01100 [Rickettsiaceae bacterium]|nr:hypothetical protein [Rickettsiaceae bacterium]